MTAAIGIGRHVPFPELAQPSLLVIGYAGRDEAAVRHHIDELAAIGIAPPPRVPMVYHLAAGLLTSATPLPSPGPRTSGEVEPVLVRAAGAWYLAVGSDHTDRELEAVDVRDSKAACPKPVSGSAIRLHVDPAAGDLDTAWDAIEVASAIDGHAYQRGRLSALRVPSDLIARATAEAPDGDLVVFCGTVPLIDGAFRYGETFAASMTGDDWMLTLEYSLETREA
jgi:4-hydroxyphenylacetate 3-monooxygenase